MVTHGFGRAVVLPVLALTVMIPVAACNRPRPGAGGGPRFGQPQVVAQGLVVPWGLAFVDRETTVVTERPGRFRVIEGGRLRDKPIGQVTVTAAGEGGLMGIALHPQFPEQRWLYAFYTAPTGNRLVRFPLAADLTLGAEQVLIDDIAESTFHDGGEIDFGPDGMLYVATGYGPNVALAADRQSLNGKILRVRPDGGVPADNPFPGSYVWSWGHRNPEGLAWDADGRLYDSEHGPTTERAGLCCNDEINLIQKGGFYGWPYRAGRVAAQLVTGQPPAPVIDPVATSGTNATWAPGNIAIWNGPDRTTHIYQANLRGSNLMHFVIDKANPSVVRSSNVELQGYGRLRSARFGPDGCLYVSTSNRDSRGVPHTGDDQLLRLCAPASGG
jgi:glucose/arabinose dehydrogenase